MTAVFLLVSYVNCIQRKQMLSCILHPIKSDARVERTDTPRPAPVIYRCTLGGEMSTSLLAYLLYCKKY